MLVLLAPLGKLRGAFYFMLWCDFKSKLKKLHPDLWVNLNGPVENNGYTTFGVYCGKHHICGVTYTDSIPLDDVYENEILVIQGLRGILRNILQGVEKYANNKSEYWKMRDRPDRIKFQINPSKVRELFGLSIQEIFKGNIREYYASLKKSDSFNNYTI